MKDVKLDVMLSNKNVMLRNDVEEERDKEERDKEERDKEERDKEERDKEERDKEEDLEREKERRKEEISTWSTDFSLEACNYYEKAGFGTISQITLDKITDMVNEFTLEWFKGAVDIAVMRNKKSLSYVQGVLNNWRAEGREEKNGSTSHHKKDASSLYDFSMFGG
ncbi:DnaD domain-containing protein [Clostridium grantii]|uniref:DnaD and phage-associated domain-containing protein n=1 Tax=Clostridium grantii DSM 8605 TaxID=1121316 RepID=A0A1M5R1N3_9CLOT|nr:DnaD domain protein [Clostridium grantii]SHH20061.1 DnaD and phage-associated domain-containing protein [Clostridium grantii DSM 8605]